MANIIDDIKLDFDDVYIRPCPTEISSRLEINLNVSYITKHSKQRFTGVPVCVANMDSIGTIKMANALYKHNIWTCLHKHISKEDLIKFINNSPAKDKTFLSIGIQQTDIDKILYIKNKVNHIPYICIDVANGYMYSFLDIIKVIRENFPNTVIMAGNVCTPEGVENIIKAGADICKSGIGGGGKCSTKNKAGVSYKQLSVAIECGQAANELDALNCSDGGCKTTADICKALAAGSHLVMSGSLFFGYEENDTDWEYEHQIDGDLVWKPIAYKKNFTGNKRMMTFGMSSKMANNKFFGGLKEYRTSEGKEEWQLGLGPISHLIQDIKGSLASCCSYTNSKNLENLYKNAVFVK